MKWKLFLQIVLLIVVLTLCARFITKKRYPRYVGSAHQESPAKTTRIRLHPVEESE